ncbi:MAG TPA: hypothetical protein VJ277_11575, partial [Gemmatimonadales bacterium]|nr:hypothetical protein [Gemmatimonadales bacterium]
PRVLLVMTDQWPRALLRAALREAGYDAVGTRAIAGAVRLAAPDPDRGQIRLVILAREALTGADRHDLDQLRAATDAPIVLLAPAGRPVEAGPWAQVIRRPVSIGALVGAVETLVPLPPDARRPVD